MMINFREWQEFAEKRDLFLKQVKNISGGKINYYRSGDPTQFGMDLEKGNKSFSLTFFTKSNPLTIRVSFRCDFGARIVGNRSLDFQVDVFEDDNYFLNVIQNITDILKELDGEYIGSGNNHSEFLTMINDLTSNRENINIKDEMENHILKTDPALIQYMENPSISLQEKLLDLDPKNIRYIKDKNLRSKNSHLAIGDRFGMFNDEEV